MPVLAAMNLQKYYGADRILAGVDLQIENGQKLGLVGRNGSGKTTLLRLIAGAEEPDGGELHRERDLRLGFLTQEYQTDDRTRTVWGEMETAFADLAALQVELERTATAMSHGVQGLPDLMARYARQQEQFERRGGYVVASRIEKVLRGMGFAEEDWAKPIRVLSGGELTRAALARLLLAEPDLLLLDEPTNHLDLWAVAWLEEYLAAYRGAVLVVSHDRYFLDRIVRGVYELAVGIVRWYPGNYTDYRRVRAEEERALRRARVVQEREIARKERLVRESAADERSKRQSRSIAKSLERMARTEAPIEEGSGMRLELRTAAPTGRIVLTVEGLGKRYGERLILDRIGFRLEAGEKVGLIGANGTGKTTLLRLLLGLEPADTGRVITGHNVQMGYFAQDEDQVGGGTVFSTMQDAGAGDNFATRSRLARFLFRGEDVWKNVADLSGGERRRLAMARLTLSGANLLLLDEPTNHLDLPSIEAFEEAITHFPGTVLVVSHDRYFLGRVTRRILALQDGCLRHFANYEQFAAWHAAEETTAAEARVNEVARRRQQQQQEREARQAPQREERRRSKALAELEARLAAKEEERARLLRDMAKPEIVADFAALRVLSTNLAALEGEIAALYVEWGALTDGL